MNDNDYPATRKTDSKEETTMNTPTTTNDQADGISGAILALDFVRALHDQDGERAHAVLVEASGIAGGVPFATNLGALASEFIEAHPDGEQITSQQRLDLDLKLHMLGRGADAHEQHDGSGDDKHDVDGEARP